MRDIHLLTKDLPTEEEIIEWTRRSRMEGICGIVSCFNNPTTQCKKCTNYYCSEYFSSHIDLLPDISDFGVKPENMFYNKEEDRFFCLLDAPNKEAIEKHHAKFGLKCEWITEVKTTA